MKKRYQSIGIVIFPIYNAGDFLLSSDHEAANAPVSNLTDILHRLSDRLYIITGDKKWALFKKDDEIHVSCRGNQQLVKQGLDLGHAMKKASEKLGGHGGGHAIASGATIEASKEEEFLNIVDKIIVNQLK